jgi:hypothetical protein
MINNSNNFKIFGENKALFDQIVLEKKLSVFGHYSY